MASNVNKRNAADLTRRNNNARKKDIAALNKRVKRIEKFLFLKSK